ncbi:MAG: hypothetical protein ABSB11_02665 [Sedimentisphaerales bacterium]|jgi:hypothetical protein
MPRTGKNNKRTERAPQGNRKTIKVEHLHPQVEITDRNYNNLAIGGRFEIESKPGSGCRATMVAPIKNTQTN